MPALQFRCPSCQAVLGVANPDLRGKPIRCPRCGGVSVVPLETPGPGSEVRRPESRTSVPPPGPAALTPLPQPVPAVRASRPAVASPRGNGEGVNAPPPPGDRRGLRAALARPSPALLAVVGVLAVAVLAGGAFLLAALLNQSPPSDLAQGRDDRIAEDNPRKAKTGKDDKAEDNKGEGQKSGDAKGADAKGKDPKGKEGKKDDGEGGGPKEAPQPDPPDGPGKEKKRPPAGPPRLAELQRQEAQVIAELTRKPPGEGQGFELLKFRQSYVNCLAFAPDGKVLAYAGNGHEGIRLLTLASGKVKELGRVEGVFTALTFAPDGTRLAAAGSANEVALWDVATGKKLQSFPGHREFVTFALFTPDGKRLVTASGMRKGAEVKVWDTDTGKPVREFKDRARGVGGMALGRDGKTVAVSLDSGDVAFWNTTTGERVLTLPAGSTGGPVAYSPDGKYFATASGPVVKVWLARGGGVREFKGAGKGYTRLAFTPDSKILIANCPGEYATDCSDTRFWDVESGELRARWGGLDAKSHVRLFSLDRLVTLSPGGRMLAGRVYEEHVELWDLNEVLDPAWTRLHRESSEWADLSTGEGGLILYNKGGKMRDEHLAGLKGLAKVVRLSLGSARQITAAGLVHLKALPGLRKLSLNDIQGVTDAGLKHVRECPRLEELQLNGCRNVTDAGLESLSGMPHLRRLEVQFSAVTEEGVRRFREKNPKVEVKR
jgi:WD40 repeat protein